MRPSTLVKVAAVVIGLPLLVLGCGVLAAINSLKDPPFDPPAVAPLGPGTTFRAERVVETDDGYLLAGVVGTSDPLRGKPCSGRFALVFVDGRGRLTRATMLHGIEQERYCAQRIDALVTAPAGGWLVAGTGVRDGGPSALFPGKPSSDSLAVTFRVYANGTLVESFGEGGLVEGHRAAGRLPGATFTTALQRMTETGAVRDDLVASDQTLYGISRFEVEGDLLVVPEFGPGLTFRTFERDAPSVPVYRPLHPLPAYQTEPTVDLGNDVSVEDTLLLDGVLYVALRGVGGTRINAVDPRRLRVRSSFNGTGAVRLRGGLVTSAKLLADGEDRLVVVMTAIDRGTPGDRLQVLRVAKDGSQDSRFGGRVTLVGRDVVLDPGVRDALIDGAGRTLVLGDGPVLVRDAPAVLVRLDDAGKLDRTFGDRGIVRLRSIRVCQLEPAASADACRRS